MKIKPQEEKMKEKQFYYLRVGILVAWSEKGTWRRDKDRLQDRRRWRGRLQRTLALEAGRLYDQQRGRSEHCCNRQG
jgi:hypothetical protein